MAVCRSETNFVGEVYELRSELNADLHLVRKEAVKKVIASMTLGKDVSSLFPDVLKNVSTEDMEMKKLVYLYLMNYATSQPELVVLAINTFCKVYPFSVASNPWVCRMRRTRIHWSGRWRSALWAAFGWKRCWIICVRRWKGR